MSMTASELLEAALDGTLKEDDAHTAPPAAVETDEQPAVAPQEATTTEQTGDEPTEVEAPILSKSGAYTIPYEELAKAREGRKAAQERVAQLEQQVAELTARQQQNLAAAQADAQTRADAGQVQTVADANLAAATQAVADGEDIALFGDFSEEAIAKGVAELNRRAMAQVEQRLMAALDDRLAPIQAREAKSATQSHYDVIYAAHKDADEIAESAEFAAWKSSLPAFARAGVEHAMTKGSAQEVVEVFDAFRAASKPQQPKDPARLAPEAPARRVPNSLSEVPGSAPMDDTAQTLAIAGNSSALLDRMATMTPAQLDALMNRI